MWSTVLQVDLFLCMFRLVYQQQYYITQGNFEILSWNLSAYYHTPCKKNHNFIFALRQQLQM